MKPEVLKGKMKKFAVLSLQLAVLLLLICGQAWGDTKKITGTTNIEDAWINETSPDNNYGDMGNGGHQIDNSPVQSMLIRVLNVASELGAGATISACVCSIYCYQEILGAKIIRAYRVFKPWVEGDENGVDDDDGDVTWNDWASDEYEWTAGALACANDDGVDNSSDNGVCDDATRRDRKASQESSQSVNSAGWFVWSVSAALAQAWYDGTANENGILLRTTDNGTAYFYGSEHSTTAPHWTFTYTVGDGVDKPRKNIMSGGILK